MSNKQDLIWLGIAEMDADLNDLKQIGTTAIHGTSKNVPPDVSPENWGLLTVSANSKNGQVGCTQHLSIMVTEGYFPRIYERNWNGLNWSKWAKLSTATPPQEFDLPLADGIIALQPCIYWKNQFEEVTIYGCTYGEVTEGDTIATLPEGFRPDHPVEWPASFTGDAGRVSGTVFISESGIVSIHTPAPAMSVVFAASFLTAS